MGSRSSLTFKFEKAPLLALQRGEAVRVRTADGAETDLARPASGAVFLFDEKYPGLTVRVPAVGEVRFWLYAWINGKAVKRSLGPVSGPEGWSVDRAREEMVKEKARVLEGRTNEAKAAAEATPKGGPTLRVVFARYIREVRGKLRTWPDLLAMFSKHVKPHARIPISSVDEAWLRNLHRRITSGGHPGAANRVLSLMSAVLSFHLGEGTPNPAAAIKRNPETERHRTLTEEEERRFLRAVDQYEAEPAGVPGSKPLDAAKFRAKQAAAQEAKRTAADLLRLLYWTGQRAGNVRAMEWSAVDLKARTWTVAARHYKGGKPHVAALPDEAVAILKRRKAAAGSDAVYVFPAGNAKSARGYFVNYHNAFHRVKELAGIDAGEGLHRDDTLRAHDLRAGLATAMANAGENAFSIQRQLGHRNIKTTMRYVRQSITDVQAAVDRTAERRRAANGTNAEEVA